MKNKYKTPVLLTLSAIAMSVICMGIAIPKANKLTQEEKTEQIKKFSYYNNQIELNAERTKKIQFYNGLATIPTLTTLMATCLYWIPTMLNENNKQK